MLSFAQGIEEELKNKPGKLGFFFSFFRQSFRLMLVPGYHGDIIFDTPCIISDVKLTILSGCYISRIFTQVLV